MLDVNEIMSLLPHRYPFLLVDRVLEIDPGKKITAIKNVTINEPFFPGHFPGHPVMPGVLIVEAMAQTAAILVYNSSEENKGKITYFVGIDNTKFRKPVVPGDQLKFELEITGCRRGIYTFSAKAFVEGKLVTESELRATFADKQS
jgi:3-hydroxyacyl-[acyl-carrier-protein] dehydratase